MRNKNSLATGPVVIAGNWEPLIFRRRMNSVPVNAEEIYGLEHTEAAAESLKQAGVNLLITHYFKGFGLSAEEEEMQNTARMVEFCHRRNIAIGGYIGDTIIHETFLLEEPFALDWIQRKADGTPVTYGGIATFRYRWCRVNPAFMAYMKKVLTKAVNSGLDMIHFDNFLNKPEPESCHCQFCREAFRSFLEQKYSERQLRERFGYSDLRCLNTPTFSQPLYIAWARDIIQDPLLQEWIDFKCQVISSVYAELSEFCRELNPNISIECNPSGFWGENSAYLRSVDHARLLSHGDFFWDESPNKHGLMANGALCTHIISMKMGEAFNNRTFFYISGKSRKEEETKLGEALAFNRGCLGMIGGLRGQNVIYDEWVKEYVQLLTDHPEFFCESRRVAQIGVFRNFASLAYNSGEPHLQTILCQQTLLQNHIPFDLVWDVDDIANYKALILPGIECLSLEELARFREYGEQGGCIITIGACASHDAWRRSYPGDFELKLTNHVSVKALPELRLPGSAPSLDERAIWDTYYPVWHDSFWLIADNADVLLHCIEQSWRLFETTAGKNTIIEPRLLKDKRTAIHIINYDHNNTEKVVSIRMNLAAVSEIQLIQPGTGRSTLPAIDQQGGIQIDIPNPATYSLLVGCFDIREQK